MEDRRQAAPPASQGAPQGHVAPGQVQEAPSAVGVSENADAAETRSAAELADTKNKGRKKIKIEFIGDNRSRQVTFLKRKNGILKKAHELSILCGSNVAVVIFNNDNGKLYEYFNPAAEETFNRYSQYTGVSERRRSDVTELGEAKGTTDMPNDEPAAAAAAMGAARMSAIRHAQPEEYVQPATGRRQLHPNVTVPAIHHLQQHIPPLPPILSTQSGAGSSSGHAQLRMPGVAAAESMERPGMQQTAGQREAIVYPSLSTPQANRALPFHIHSSAIAQQTSGGQPPNPFGLPALPPAEHIQQGNSAYRADFHSPSGHKPPRDPKDVHTSSGMRTGHEGTQGPSLSSAGTPLTENTGLTPLYSTEGRKGTSFDAGGAFRHSIPGDLTGGRPMGPDALTPSQNAGPRTESPPFPQPRAAVTPLQPSSMGLWSGQGSMLPREPPVHPSADTVWASPYFRHSAPESERMETPTSLPPLTPLQVYGGDGELGPGGQGALPIGGQQTSGYNVQGQGLAEVGRPTSSVPKTEPAQTGQRDTTGAHGRDSVAAEAGDETPDLKRAKKERG